MYFDGRANPRRIPGDQVAIRVLDSRTAEFRIDPQGAVISLNSRRPLRAPPVVPSTTISLTQNMAVGANPIIIDIDPGCITDNGTGRYELGPVTVTQCSNGDNRGESPSVTVSIDASKGRPVAAYARSVRVTLGP